MNTIKIGMVGKILSGTEEGYNVKVVDDANKTGGYYIFMSNPDNPKEGYDGWVLNTEELIAYFKGSKWKISWENEQQSYDYLDCDVCIE